MRITVLAGGIGGARFTRGLLHHLRRTTPDARVTVIGNTGDDIQLFGLQVCPDLDTVMYTLGGGISEERGWGREDETFAVKEELAAYGVKPDWFGLGDRDVATHLVRTQMLYAGYSLTAVTAALCERWQPGVELLPMSDYRLETHVVVDGDEPGTRKAIHFQEWWVRHRASIPAHSFVLVGLDEARPAPGVLDAIRDADVVLLPPSNPVVSIGTILQVPGIRDAVRTTAAPVVGVSPIVGGAPVRGMADACLATIGVETSAVAVAQWYGARRPPTATTDEHGWAPAGDAGRGGARRPPSATTDEHGWAPAGDAGRGGARRPTSATTDEHGSTEEGGLLDGWLVHDATDAAAVDALSPLGIRTRAVPLLMTDVEATAAIAAEALSLADEVRR